MPSTDLGEAEVYLPKEAKTPQPASAGASTEPFTSSTTEQSEQRSLSELQRTHPYAHSVHTHTLIKKNSCTANRAREKVESLVPIRSRGRGLLSCSAKFDLGLRDPPNQL